MTRYLKVTLVAAFIGGLFIAPAVSADLDGPAIRKTDRADATAVFWGINGKEDAYFLYGGAVHALNGDLSAEGFLLRGFIGFGEYEYKNAAVAGGEVNGDVVSMDASAGYQIFTGNMRLTGYVGLAFENNDLSPNDSGNSTRGDEVGIKLQAEIAGVGIAPWHWSAMGSYGSANDSYWARLRVGHEFGQVIVGPEGLLMGNNEYDGQRIGGFITLPQFGAVSISLSGGYADVDGTQGGDSVYGAIDFSTTF